MLNPKGETPSREGKSVEPTIDPSGLTPFKHQYPIGGTILHNTVYSSLHPETISLSFITYLLKLNQKHKLGLLEEKNGEEKTFSQLLQAPLIRPNLEKSFSDQRLEEKQEEFKKRQKLWDETRIYFNKALTS